MAETRRRALVAALLASAWSGTGAAAPAKVLDEDVTATAETQYGPLAPWGYAPAWVELRNNERRPRRVELTFRTHARAPGARREVLLDPNETRVVSIPLPADTYGGTLEVRTPSKKGVVPLTLRNADVPRIMVVGSASSLVAAAGFSTEKSPSDNFAPADHALATLFETSRRALPDLTAGFVGQTVVVLTDAGLGELSPGQRAALEAWVATGGQLVYGPVPLAEGLPASLRIGEGARAGGSVAHGFGRVFAYPDTDALAAALRPLLAQGDRDTGIALDEEGLDVVPVDDGFDDSEAVPGEDEPPPAAPVVPFDRPVARTRAPADDSGANLLEGIGKPPVAAFLFIILLYVLAVGPGSLLVARRLGRMWVLVTVPVTAFATCTGIGVYGIASDGLTTIHSASANAVLLEPGRKRAIVVGSRAVYAALSPRAVGESVLGAIVPAGSAFDGTPWVADWTEGARIVGDVVPSRSYRVLPFVTVQPSVARLVLTGDASAPQVENALGGPVRRVTLKAGGKLWRAQDVAPGVRVPLAERADPWGRDAELDGTLLPGFVSQGIASTLVAPLQEGEFLAVLDRWSEAPTANLDVTEHDSHHVIRGTVQR